MVYQIRFVEEPPSPEGYAELRKLAGWRSLSLESYGVGLSNALYSVSVYEGESLVACGRIVGDGAIYFYLQDVIVHPRLRGQGIGRAIMERLMVFLSRQAKPNAFVGLMAARGVEDFYHRWGFQRRPEDGPGMALNLSTGKGK